MNYGIGNVKGKSSGGVSGGNVWHTWTQANFIDGEATFSISNIVKPNDMPLSVADKVLYVDGNDKIVECYMVDAIGDISVTLVKVGDFSSGGRGSQLYQHNIQIKGTINDTAWSIILMITIVSSSNLPFVKSNDYVNGTNQNFMQWLQDNHYTLGATPLLHKYFNANGASSNNSFSVGIAISQDNYFYTSFGSDSTPTRIVGTTLTDDVLTI